MRALRYFFDEARVSLWRGRQSGVMAVATITAALLVLGGFLLVTTNMERLLGRWREAAEFSVYLRDDVTGEQRAALERVLRDNPAVAALEYISKDDALRRFRRNFGDLAAAADSLPENPLPASLEIRLSPAAAPADLDALAQQSRGMPGVADVRYDQTWIERFGAAVTFVRGLGIVLAAVMTLAAALTVASVVRLALLVRRDEIQIMQLVGAPLAYIKGPFVVEGVLQGGIGALIALALLWGGFMVTRSRYGGAVTNLLGVESLMFLPIQVCVGLLAGGMAVGFAGGLVAARSTAEIVD